MSTQISCQQRENKSDIVEQILARNESLGRETHCTGCDRMDEDNDLLTRLNILILNALNLVERVEQMIENSQMCGDAVHLGEEENVNTDEEEDDQDVEEGGDVGSEGWRTPSEDLVVAASIIFSTSVYVASASFTSLVKLVMLNIRRRPLQKVGGHLQRLLDEQ